MDYLTIDVLRERHPAWRLLRASNATLILSFLGRFFVEGNRGATGAAEVASALDDDLYALNADVDQSRYPKSARAYLEDWAATDAGFLRRFYPTGVDEVHYEVTPAFEKAFAWVESLRARSFVGTESRLHTVLELLRQIVHGSETDPDARLAELRRQRNEIDAQIAAVEAGEVVILDETGVRDRYQQFASTARELLRDFREVEENFRGLDRAAREKIAAWDGSKGELLAELVGSRSDIAGSDQGRSFQAFHDFLLSESRQDELADLLAQVTRLGAVESDHRVRSIHHDWSEAAERAQRTVRQISEQLRRFLDDQVWLENRRVLDLVRAVETMALELRSEPPTFGLEVDEPGIAIALPFERPLYEPPAGAEVESFIPPANDEDLDADVLFSQSFVDAARLAGNIRAVLPERSSALLADIIGMYPVEQGAAEIVGYLALSDDDLTLEMDETDETLLEYADPEDPARTLRARLPKVTVTRS
jgi:flagellar motility protein MotE (MotC chaperone)